MKDLFLELVPKSLGDAFANNNLAQLVLVTVALAIGLAKIRNEQRAKGEHAYKALVEILVISFELLMRVLLWVVALVPFAVFGVVATALAREGFELFLNLGWFIVVVLAGLGCQLMWYLSQLGAFARMSPWRFLRGAADVVATTFSTSSTAATMPVTLKALMNKLKVSRESSQLAACVGTNFNNDGTALYQAVAALFFAQALGARLEFTDQLVIVITTLVASVGAGGIPSGSFVTMPLIFAAVDLPADKLPILLTIDWFLDRCRTTSNVLGDMTVAVLLDLTGGRRGRRRVRRSHEFADMGRIDVRSGVIKITEAARLDLAIRIAVVDKFHVAAGVLEIGELLGWHVNGADFLDRGIGVQEPLGEAQQREERRAVGGRLEPSLVVEVAHIVGEGFAHLAAKVGVGDAVLPKGGVQGRDHYALVRCAMSS